MPATDLLDRTGPIVTSPLDGSTVVPSTLPTHRGLPADPLTGAPQSPVGAAADVLADYDRDAKTRPASKPSPATALSKRVQGKSLRGMFDAFEKEASSRTREVGKPENRKEMDDFERRIMEKPGGPEALSRVYGIKDAGLRSMVQSKLVEVSRMGRPSYDEKRLPDGGHGADHVDLTQAVLDATSDLSDYDRQRVAPFLFEAVRYAFVPGRDIVEDARGHLVALPPTNADNVGERLRLLDAEKRRLRDMGLDEAQLDQEFEFRFNQYSDGSRAEYRGTIPVSRLTDIPDDVRSDPERFSNYLSSEAGARVERWKSLGPRDWLESTTDTNNWAKAIPKYEDAKFARIYWAALRQQNDDLKRRGEKPVGEKRFGNFATDALSIIESSSAIRDYGEPGSWADVHLRRQDQLVLQKYLLELKERETRGGTVASKAMDLGFNMIPFVYDILLTNPASAVGKEGVKALGKGWLKRSSASYLKRRMGERAFRMAYGIVETGAQVAASSVARTLASPQRVASTFTQDITPYLQKDAAGNWSLSDTAPSSDTVFLDACLNVATEYATEEMGEALFSGAIGKGANALKKSGLGREAQRTAQKAYNRTARWLVDNGHAASTKEARGLLAQKYGQGLRLGRRLTHIEDPFSESLEERAGEVLRAAFGTTRMEGEGEDTFLNRYAREVPGGDDLLAEFLMFGAMNLLNLGAGGAATDARAQLAQTEWDAERLMAVRQALLALVQSGRPDLANEWLARQEAIYGELPEALFANPMETDLSLQGDEAGFSDVETSPHVADVETSLGDTGGEGIVRIGPLAIARTTTLSDATPEGELYGEGRADDKEMRGEKVHADKPQIKRALLPDGWLTNALLGQMPASTVTSTVESTGLEDSEDKDKSLSSSSASGTLGQERGTHLEAILTLREAGYPSHVIASMSREDAIAMAEVARESEREVAADGIVVEGAEDEDAKLERALTPDVLKAKAWTLTFDEFAESIYAPAQAELRRMADLLREGDATDAEVESLLGVLGTDLPGGHTVTQQAYENILRGAFAAGYDVPIESLDSLAQLGSGWAVEQAKALESDLSGDEQTKRSEARAEKRTKKMARKQLDKARADLQELQTELQELEEDLAFLKRNPKSVRTEPRPVSAEDGSETMVEMDDIAWTERQIRQAKKDIRDLTTGTKNQSGLIPHLESLLGESTEKPTDKSDSGLIPDDTSDDVSDDVSDSTSDDTPDSGPNDLVSEINGRELYWSGENASFAGANIVFESSEDAVKVSLSIENPHLFENPIDFEALADSLRDETDSDSAARVKATEHLEAQGYDAAYVRGDEFSDPQLVVFDQSKLSVAESAAADASADEAPVSANRERVASQLQKKLLIGKDNVAAIMALLDAIGESSIRPSGLFKALPLESLDDFYALFDGVAEHNDLERADIRSPFDPVGVELHDGGHFAIVTDGQVGSATPLGVLYTTFLAALNIADKQGFGPRDAGLKKWVGMDPDSTAREFTPEAAEKVAAAFLRWVRPGKTPYPSLQKEFALLGASVRKAAKKIKGTPLDVELTDDIRRFLENLMGLDLGERMEVNRRREYGQPPPIDELVRRYNPVVAFLNDHFSGALNTRDLSRDSKYREGLLEVRRLQRRNKRIRFNEKGVRFDEFTAAAMDDSYVGEQLFSGGWSTLAEGKIIDALKNANTTEELLDMWRAEQIELDRQEISERNLERQQQGLSPLDREEGNKLREAEGLPPFYDEAWEATVADNDESAFAFLDARPAQASRPAPSERESILGGDSIILPTTLPRGELLDGAVVPLLYRGDKSLVLPKEPQGAPPKNLVAPHDIIKEMEALFQVPIRVGTTGKRKSIKGYYVHWANLVRLQAAGDIATALHEVMHHLDEAHGITPELESVGGEALKQARAADYAAAGRTSEGLAEYIAHRMLGAEDKLNPNGPLPTELRQWWDRWLSRHSEVAKKLAHIDGLIQTWKLQGSQARVRAQRTSTGKAPSGRELESTMGFTDKLYGIFVDNKHVITKMVNAMRGGEEIEHGERADTIARVLDQAAPAQARGAVENGLYSPVTGEKMADSLRDALAQIGKGELEDFVDFLYSQHALDVIADGRDPGGRAEDHRYVFEQYRSNERFARAAAKLTEFNNALVRLMAQVGRITDAEAQRIIEKYPHYVPLRRVMDEELRDIGGRRSVNHKTLVNTARPVKSMKGSQRLILNPLESMVAMTEEVFSVVNKTLVINKLIDMAWDENGNPVGLNNGRYIERLLGEPRGTEPNTVALYRNGKKQWFRFDKELYAAIRSMDYYQLPWMLETILGAPKRLVRLGATGLSPAFTLRNLLRDTLTFLMQTQQGGFVAHKPVMEMLGFSRQEMRRFLKGEYSDPVLELWHATGGDLSQPLGLDRKSLVAQVQRVLADDAKGRAMGVVRHPIEAIRAALSATEVGSRMAEFRAVLKKHGWDAERMKREGRRPPQHILIEAMHAANEVTVDFKRAGSLGRVVNRMSAFFNPAIQGVDKAIRTGKQHTLRTLLRGVAYIFAPTLALWYMNKDEDWYEEMEDWQRYGFWNFKPHPDGPIVRIPKPFEWGLGLASFPEAVADRFYHENPEAMGDFLGFAAQQTVPPMIPSLFAPSIQVAMNEDPFGRPIVAEWKKKSLEGRDQYNNYTTELMKAMGDLVNYSPAEMEHLVNQHTGGLYRRIETSVENGLRATGLLNDRPVLPLDFADVPAAGTLFQRGTPGRSVGDLYDRREELGRIIGSAELDGEKAPAAVRREYKRLNAAAIKLSDLRERRYDVLFDAELSMEERREKARALEVKMVNVARKALGKKPAYK